MTIDWQSRALTAESALAAATAEAAELHKDIHFLHTERTDMLARMEAAEQLADAVRKSTWPRTANVREKLQAYDILTATPEGK